MTITQYKGIEVAVPAYEVTEEVVNQQIDAMLAQNPKKVEKDGPVENGDICAIDYKGCKDGVPFQGGTGSYDLEIGSHSFIPGFEEKMIGMVKGETRDLELTFPEQYHAPELAGADVVFTVTVNSIFKSEAAAFDDEFAMSLEIPGVKTAEALKQYLTQAMKSQAAQGAQRMAEEAVMTTLLANSDAEPAEDRINVIIDGQINQIRMSMRNQGITLEQYLEMTGMSMDMMREQVREDAAKQVKLEETLLEIAALENFEVTAEELDAHYTEIAAAYGVEVEAIRSELSEETVAQDLKCRKAHALVMDNANIKMG